MWKFYLKFAYRNIMSQKLASSLAMLSLCTGLVTFTLVTGYVSYEHSYDRHFPDYEHIYRITTAISVEGELQIDLTTSMYSNRNFYAIQTSRAFP